MWVNVVGEGQNDLRIFSEGNTSNSNPLFNLGTHNGGADGSLDFYLRQSGWDTFGHAYSEQQPFDGSWHHIAWVQDESPLPSLRRWGVIGLPWKFPDQEEGDSAGENTSIGGILRASALTLVHSADEIQGVIDNGVPSAGGVKSTSTGHQ